MRSRPSEAVTAHGSPHLLDLFVVMDLSARARLRGRLGLWVPARSKSEGKRIPSPSMRPGPVGREKSRIASGGAGQVETTPPAKVVLAATQTNPSTRVLFGAPPLRGRGHLRGVETARLAAWH